MKRVFQLALGLICLGAIGLALSFLFPESVADALPLPQPPAAAELSLRSSAPLSPPPLFSPKPEPTPSPTPALTPAITPEPTPESTPEPTAAPTPEPAPSEAPRPVNRGRLPILMLHHVVPDDYTPNNWTVTVSELRGYLQWLSDHGYTSILPSQLVSGQPLPQRPVLITFDDGYSSNYYLAYPLLQEFQQKAVISIIVRKTQEGDPSFLSWDMCREMVSSGLVEIGSHTYDNHAEEGPCLSRGEGETREEYEARVFPDIDLSIQLMEENLGCSPLFFAYPGGRHDPWSDEFLAQRFSVTVTTHYGTAALSKGLYLLPRYTINRSQPVSAVLPS